MRAKAINHQHHAFRLDGRSEFRGRLAQKRSSPSCAFADESGLTKTRRTAARTELL
jgi:hypothetical protein